MGATRACSFTIDQIEKKDTETLEAMVRKVAKFEPEKLYLLVLGIVGHFTDPTIKVKDKVVTVSGFFQTTP